MKSLESTSPPSVTQLHRQMLDQLVELDQLGEHVAAAHLTAAIDALEERLDARTTHPRDRRTDPVEAMAHGLIERFGKRAAEVSRLQMRGASGQTFLVWAAISSRIDQVQNDRTSFV